MEIAKQRITIYAASQTARITFLLEHNASETTAFIFLPNESGVGREGPHVADPSTHAKHLLLQESQHLSNRAGPTG